MNNDSDDAIGQNENSVSQEECDESEEEASNNGPQTNGAVEQSSADVSQDGSRKDEESGEGNSSDSDDAGKENEDAESDSDSSDDSSEDEDEAEGENTKVNNENAEDDAVSLQDSEEDDDTSQDVEANANSQKKVTNVIYVGDNSNWLGKSIDDSPMVLSDSDEYEDEEDPVEISQNNDAALKFLNINKELTIEGLNIKKKTSLMDAKSTTKSSTGVNHNFASITMQKQTNNNNDHNNKPKSNPQAALEAIYSNIAARGITLTPVPKPKSVAPPPTIVPSQSSSPQPNQTPQQQQVILSSLTDDMYVVEAPSFIVPYVYEKPSKTAFREYVDTLKEELAAKNELETPRIDDFDIDLSSLKDLELAAKQDVASKKRKSKKNTDEDYSWDGKTSDSDSELDEPKPVPVKPNDAAKPPTDIKPPLDNYFVKPLGTFFMNIGMNLVQEYVQRDLLKQQKRKLYKENRTGEGDPKLTEAAIVSLTKNIESSVSKNQQYKYEMKKCSFCSFQSESSLVVSHHLETPHMKSNLYKCNFCEYEIKSPHDILYHMEAEHNIRGRLERAPSYHPCANCPFEDNGKSKLARHMIACAKKFKPEHNLMPPVEWEPPAKIPKITPNRVARGYQPITARPPPMLLKPNVAPQIIPNSGTRKPVLPPGTQRPIQGAPLFKGGVMYRNNQQILPNNDYRLLQGGQTTIRLESSKSSAKPVQHHPSISITPLPRAPPAATTLPPHISSASSSAGNNSGSKATFVICEICDGYIKDLEQLRNHMMWIHKVKIHPKMIYNRPPLNCQKCQFRFFTDQGLERHLLGSHGLVTSSMQEAANKSKDAGRCPACGKVFQWKLLNHVARDHNMTLKPAYLSYKCTVCTATFGMYKLFENHVYSAHSGVARRVT